MLEMREGFLSFKGYKIYYKIVGTQIKDRTPLLVIHGGPGSNHNYLLGLANIAKSGRQVIFYDQLGSGKSEMPDDPALWTIDLFLEELKVIRQELHLDEVHLLGHSWGGMLAIEYLLRKPTGVRATILASSMISIPLYQIEVDKLKAQLPGTAGEALFKHEQAGTLDVKEYQKAYKVYSKHHLYRGDAYPTQYSSPPGRTGKAAYEKLWGPNEAFANGELKNWDKIKQLHQITIPTLVTCGQYDELTPWQAAITRDELTNGSLRIITNGSHLAHIEEEETYLQVLNDFLAKIES